MVRKILRTTDPNLRVASHPVAKIDKKILDLIEDLKDTLVSQKDPEGVGLAAPQIGKTVRIFVMLDSGVPRAIINPEVIKLGAKIKAKTKKGQIMEGCLSLPNYYGPLKRAADITIKYSTSDGKEKIETFSGFTAQIVQHEIDHLNGILFIDRLLEQKKKLYKLEKDEWEEVEI